MRLSGGREDDSDFLAGEPSGRRATLTHKQLQGPWKRKGRLPKRTHTHTHTHTKKKKKKEKKTIGGREERLSEPRARLGTQVSANVCGSEMPLNMCAVTQLAGCFHHRCVFAHIAGCHSVLPG